MVIHLSIPKKKHIGVMLIVWESEVAMMKEKEVQKLYATIILINFKIIRIFNTYGPFMAKDDGRVVTNFINQALYNTDITIYGEGSQTRSFQYVDDLIEAMTRVMKTDNTFHGPINLGNPHEFTIKELAELTLELIKDSKSKIVYEDLPADDPCKRKPDISLAKEKIKWEPVVQLREGLQKTIDYFKKIKELDEKNKK